jgi:putative oxidoreductase
MDHLDAIAATCSRLLIAAIFLANGVGLIDQSDAADELAGRGVPPTLVRPLMLAGRTAEIVAGLALVLGVCPRLASLVLLAFLVPATLVSHAFWTAKSREVFQARLKGFFSNLAIGGALTFLAAVGPGRGWGP